MRKHYLDNIRWITVILVVIYHVIYMYNGVATAGVIGPFEEQQIQDGIQYLLYPWFMVLLFVISGASARFYLENHSVREFIASKTRKCLIPSTVGLLAFHWIQGYYNMSISHAFDSMPKEMPGIAMYFIMVLSGTGVLWYIQMLWVFSMILAVVKRFEKGKLFALSGKIPMWGLLFLVIPMWLFAQIGNTPVITVYRFGIYGFAFMVGYFVFAHEGVMEKLAQNWKWLSAIAIILGILYTGYYWGENYATEPVVNSPFSVCYGWMTILAVFACGKKWLDFSNSYTQWMCKKSFGLYVFHYLPLSAVAYYMNLYTQWPAIGVYFITAAASFLGAFILYEIVSRIPILKRLVLGL